MMISYKKTIFWRILLLTILCLPGCQRDKTTNVTPSEPQKQKSLVSRLPDKQAAITDTNNKGLRTAISEKHNRVVHSAVFTPGGKFLVTASHTDPCKVWEVATGREIRQFGNGTYTRIGISPDGKFVAAAQDKHTIKLYDIFTGKEIQKFTDESEKYISLLHFTADGRYLISAHSGHVLKWWDLKTGQISKQWRTSKLLTEITFSVDGKYIAVAGGIYEDAYLHVLNVSDGKIIKTIPKLPHRVAFESLCFSQDSQYLAAGYRGFVRIWDLEKESVLREIDIDKGVKIFDSRGPVSSVTFSSDSKTVRAFSAYDFGKQQKVTDWELSTGRNIASTDLSNKHLTTCNDGYFSSDGRWLLTAAVNGSVNSWDLDNGKYVRDFGGKTFGVHVAYSSSRNHLLVASTNLTLWDMSRGKQLRSTRAYGRKITCLSVDSQAKIAVTGSLDTAKGDSSPFLTVWDYENGIPLYELTNKKFIDSNPYQLATILPGTKQLLTRQFKKFTMWDISTKQKIWSKNIGESYIWDCALSNNNTMIAIVGERNLKANSLEIYDIDTGSKIRSYKAGKRNESVAFSHSDKYILTGGWWRDSSVRCFEIATGKQIFQVQFKKNSRISALAFSSDERSFLAAAEGELSLWSFPEGKLLHSFKKKPGGYIKNVSFLPNDTKVISTDGAGMISVWDVKSGTLIVKMYPSGDGEWITFSEDGYYDASIEGSGLVHWVPPEGLATYSFNQFETFFKKSEILKERLAGNLLAGKPAPLVKAPPTVYIENKGGQKTSQSVYPVSVKAKSRGSIINKIRVFNNAKPAVEKTVQTKEIQYLQEVKLQTGSNRISVIAYDENGFSSTPQYVDVVKQGDKGNRPDLHILSVGISDYPLLDLNWQLDYAASDAQAIAQTLENKRGLVFGNVHSHILTNKKASIENITASLFKFRDLSPDDLFLLFFAGHGVQVKNGEFFFLTQSGSAKRPEKGGLNWKILEKSLSSIRARTIVLLDACHSGSIVNETIVHNEDLAQEFFKTKRGGVIVFSASKGRQSSLESPDFGGGFGLFTFAVTEALGNKSQEADTDRSGYVEFQEMVQYVSEFVNETSTGLQTPWLTRKEMIGDFALTRVH